MINLLKGLTDKGDDIQEEKGIVSRKMGILRKSQKGNQEIKNTVSRNKE